MSLRDIPVRTIADAPTTLAELAGDSALLIVNVASRCGLTPQYSGLVELQKEYGQRGFSVVGVPCNQFMGQEPGSAEEIQEFCSTTYGVDFPAAGEGRGQRRGQAPALRRADRHARRRGSGRRRPVELREVPGRP
ncbi:hypothetical protein GCM10020219_073250 [Nonomuraea dietziae]